MIKIGLWVSKWLLHLKQSTDSEAVQIGLFDLWLVWYVCGEGGHVGILRLQFLDKNYFIIIFLYYVLVGKLIYMY